MQTLTVRNGIHFDESDMSYPAVDKKEVTISAVRRVALTGANIRHVQPELSVSVGDGVSAGQALFSDRAQPDVIFTSPASGTVTAIELGRRRSLDLIEITLDDERDPVSFTKPNDTSDRHALQTLLLKSGLWTTFHTRPFNHIPIPRSIPDNIFITAIDSEPLAPDPRQVLQPDLELFRFGLVAIATLTDGMTWVCQSPGPALGDLSDDTIRDVAFSGRHPAGNAGTHIQALSPINRHSCVWSISYTDVVAVGALLEQGTLRTSRVVSVAGSAIKQPRLVQVPIGANLSEILDDAENANASCILSGSALSGRVQSYLGQQHKQVTVMQSGKKQHGWVHQLRSNLNRYFSDGGAIMPDPWLESVTPLTELAVPLLRALAIGDNATAEACGALRFASEDIALLSRVCSAGHDYTTLLNQCLDELASTLSQDETA